VQATTDASDQSGDENNINDEEEHYSGTIDEDRPDDINDHVEEDDCEIFKGDELEEEEEGWEDGSEVDGRLGPEGDGEGGDEDEADLMDDVLGPDDGEVDEDDIAGLGFAAF
jgi:hypothetical protein